MVIGFPASKHRNFAFSATNFDCVNEAEHLARFKVGLCTVGLCHQKKTRLITFLKKWNVEWAKSPIYILFTWSSAKTEEFFVTQMSLDRVNLKKYLSDKHLEMFSSSFLTFMRKKLELWTEKINKFLHKLVHKCDEIMTNKKALSMDIFFKWMAHIS